MMLLKIKTTSPNIQASLQTLVAIIFARALIFLWSFQVHSCKPWNWKALSRHYYTPWTLVVKYPDKLWDWDSFSSKRMLNWRVVAAFPDKPWNYNCLAKQQDTNWRIITYKHMHKYIRYDTALLIVKWKLLI
jgi:hypothetical protein